MRYRQAHPTLWSKMFPQDLRKGSFWTMRYYSYLKWVVAAIFAVSGIGFARYIRQTAYTAASVSTATGDELTIAVIVGAVGLAFWLYVKYIKRFLYSTFSIACVFIVIYALYCYFIL